MNQSLLKTFAQNARRQLREQVELRLDYVLTADTAELRQRATQVKVLKDALAQEGREGLIERVAYTWFNRLAALRFMDANGYHPFGARVITPASDKETLPELLQHARAGALDAGLRPHLDTPETFDGVLSGAIPTPSREGTAYRMLLIAACHYYHRLLPYLFEQLGDATELLLPDDLLTEHSLVHSFRSDLSDEDFREVEVLGWFYQFYISERKDQVMARKSAVPTEDIPAVTQLFTPHWIVRYLVENSLGRLWLLNRPGSRLREHMPYYIEGENTAPGGSPAETDFLKITKPEEIRLCDPAVGSGHMLTYAFDLLTLIYEEEGYAPTEIPALILRHNLHGLEICPRAAQLAELALVFKAREKSRRFFQPEHLVRPRIIELRDVSFAENELRDYIHALGLGDLFHQPVLKLLHQFEEAKNFGSLIQPCLDERAIADLRRAIEAKDLGGQLFLRETHLKVLRVLEQAEALTQRYHVVVANPPYMGIRNANAKLRAFLEAVYSDTKYDLYSAFIEQSSRLAIKGGYFALITMHGWMFLLFLEGLRNRLLNQSQFGSILHLGTRAFPEISGEVVQAAAFSAKSGSASKDLLVFDLTNADSADAKERAFKEALGGVSSLVHRVAASKIKLIPTQQITYSASPAVFDAFEKLKPLETYGEPKQGLATCNNGLFLRNWPEVALLRIFFTAKDRESAKTCGARWFPYHKGGTFRKWYGNHDLIVNWEKDGEAIHRYSDLPIDYNGAPVRAKAFYFRPGMTWSSLTGGGFSGRVSPHGFVFDSKGPILFAKRGTEIEFLTAFLNSSVADRFLSLVAPTLDFTQGPVGRVPLVRSPELESQVRDVCSRAVTIARADWDNFETSWDFLDQPLLRPGLKGATLEASWRNWEAQSTAAIRRMQELETENNRLFITAYGLDGELQPEVPEEQITLARADQRKDMAAFLSYAVGCMMGRYSPDHPGLILANAGDSLREFLEKVGKPLAELTFAPDEDGIIPVLDGEWFEDDIVARTRDFLRATFGDETLSENLAFIEASLGKELRKYFVSQFYKDHLQTYKKRPIYWMISSPNGSFQALIYLHRYTRDTVNLLLNDYVRELIGKLDAHHKQLTAVAANESARASDRTKAAKEITKIDKMLKEVRAWERDVVLPLAQQRIELDLDDGVKVNYLKFPGLLVPIPGLEKKEEE